MGCRIDPSRWTYWAISCSSQCSISGVTNAVFVLSCLCGIVHIKETLLLIRKSSPCSGGSRFPFSLSIGMVLYHLCIQITIFIFYWHYHFNFCLICPLKTFENYNSSFPLLLWSRINAVAWIPLCYSFSDLGKETGCARLYPRQTGTKTALSECAHKSMTLILT